MKTCPVCTCSAESIRQVLCEVLAGIDSEVIVSLLRDALEVYTQGEETGRRDARGEIHAARRGRNVPAPILSTKAVRPHRIVRNSS